MDHDLLTWKTNKFLTNISKLVSEYKGIRNRIDFELICYSDLINKWAREFYYQKGSFKDKIFLAQADSEDYLNSLTSGTNDPFDTEISSFRQELEAEAAKLYSPEDEVNVEEDMYESENYNSAPDLDNVDEDGDPDDNDLADGEDGGDGQVNKETMIPKGGTKVITQTLGGTIMGQTFSPDCTEEIKLTDTKKDVQGKEDKKEHKTILKKQTKDETNSEPKKAIY